MEPSWFFKERTKNLRLFLSISPLNKLTIICQRVIYLPRVWPSLWFLEVNSFTLLPWASKQTLCPWQRMLSTHSRVLNTLQTSRKIFSTIEDPTTRSYSFSRKSKTSRPLLQSVAYLPIKFLTWEDLLSLNILMKQLNKSKYWALKCLTKWKPSPVTTQSLQLASMSCQRLSKLSLTLRMQWSTTRERFLLLVRRKPTKTSWTQSPEPSWVCTYTTYSSLQTKATKLAISLTWLSMEIQPKSYTQGASTMLSQLEHIFYLSKQSLWLSWEAMNKSSTSRTPINGKTFNTNLPSKLLSKV